MVVGCQIRAARALLDMSQDELAKAAGLTPQAIRKIESGDVQPREGTIADIVRVFHERRLEFTDNQGVRFRPEDVEVLNGDAGLMKFFDKVYELARLTGVNIRQNNIEEGLFDKFGPKATKIHRERMAPLVASRSDIFVRAILREGDMNFVCTNYADYRWFPKMLPPPVSYYIFGDNVGIFTFETDTPPKIIFISSPTITKAYSTQFDLTWDMAQIPPIKT